MATVTAPPSARVPGVKPLGSEIGRSAARASRSAFAALLLRDLRVLIKNLKEFIPRTVIQPFLLVFVFLYGLSMDYEVFMLSRMREAYDETGSTQKAIELGLARTGKLVTSGALILMFAFLVLSSSPGFEVKEFAIGLAAGIILDARIVKPSTSRSGRSRVWSRRVSSSPSRPSSTPRGSSRI